MRGGGERFLFITGAAIALVAWVGGFYACLSAGTSFPDCASAPMVHLLPGFLNEWAIIAVGTVMWIIALFVFRAI